MQPLHALPSAPLSHSLVRTLQAVASFDDRFLLTGGAGTGKSFTLRAIIQAGVIDNGIPHSGIVSGDR